VSSRAIRLSDLCVIQYPEPIRVSRIIDSESKTHPGLEEKFLSRGFLAPHENLVLSRRHLDVMTGYADPAPTQALLKHHVRKRGYYRVVSTKTSKNFLRSAFWLFDSIRSILCSNESIPILSLGDLRYILRVLHSMREVHTKHDLSTFGRGLMFYIRYVQRLCRRSCGETSKG